MLYGLIGVVGAVGCPPAGIFFAVACVREPKKSRASVIFGQAVLAIAAVSVIVYGLLFAGGQLPLTSWLIPG